MENKFTNFKFTTEGKDTLTEVLAAKGSIAITQVYTFATKLTDALVFTQLSSLNPKQIKPVGTVSAQSNTVETRLQIDNADLTADYNLQGIALVGTFNKTNFVLGYINTNEATNVPAFSGNQVQTIALDVSFAISDTSVITINTQTAGMLTVADYNALVAFIKDQVAPLSVDKQVVHLTSNEIIDGIKTFKQKITGSISGNANTVDYINIHQITANIDLNTLTTNGNYLSTLETKTTSNKPGGTSEQYTLISTGNIQVFNDIKTDKTYIRNYIKSDTFTSWKVVIEDIDQTLNAQFNFTKVPTVNSKPVAIQADLQTETTNRTNADKTISNSLATEVSDRKSGDTTNANTIQAETTARSQADSSAVAALNTEKAARSAADTNISNSLASELSARSAADAGLAKSLSTLSDGLNDEKVARSSADSTLTKAVSDTQVDLQSETTNRTNNDNRIDSSAVHKTGNETIDGIKTFSSLINGNINGNAGTTDKLRIARLIGGVNFDGGSNINLPGVNTQGNQNTSGNAATATKLATPRKINGTVFDGTNDISVNAANDSNLVHKDSNETIIGSKTYKDLQNFQAGFTGGEKAQKFPVADFKSIFTKMYDYSGNYYQDASIIANGPTNILSGWGTIEVIGRENQTAGIIIYHLFSQKETWIGTANDGVLSWYKIAQDNQVVHTSGNETVNGAKTFGSPINGNVNGNATSADKLKTVRSIGGVSFDGSSNINLPGVNTAGNQSTSGNAGSATKLATARTINGTAFDGTKDISINAANDSNLVHQSGNESISGNKTFTGSVRFSDDVNIVSATAREQIFDGYDLNGYTDTYKYVINGANNLVNYPSSANTWATLDVDKINQNTSTQTLTDTNNKVFIRNIGRNPATWSSWVELAKDDNVVHQSGNESIAGNKTFTGTVTAGGTQLTDSGWKSLTLSVGGSVKYRKVNGIVYVKGDSIPALNNENKTMTTLPAGYRPYDTIWFPWYAGSSMGNLNIKSDGTILKASSNNQGNDQVQMSFFISYPADN